MAKLRRDELAWIAKQTRQCPTCKHLDVFCYDDRCIVGDCKCSEHGWDSEARDPVERRAEKRRLAKVGRRLRLTKKQLEEQKLLHEQHIREHLAFARSIVGSGSATGGFLGQINANGT